MTEIFRSHLPALPSNAQHQDSEKPIMPVSSNTPEHESSRIRRLEKLIKRL